MARLKSFGKPSRNDSGSLKQPRQTGPRPAHDVSVKKAAVKTNAATKLKSSELVIKKAVNRKAAATTVETVAAESRPVKRKAVASTAPAQQTKSKSARKDAIVLQYKAERKARLAREAAEAAEAAAAAVEDNDDEDAADETPAPAAAAAALVEHEAEEDSDSDSDDDEEDEDEVSTGDDDDNEVSEATVVGHDGTVLKPRRRTYAFHRKQKMNRMRILQTKGGLRFATEVGFKRLSRWAFEAVASRDPSIDLKHVKITRAARATAQGCVESLMGTVLTSSANLAYDGKASGKTKTKASPRIRPNFIKGVASIYLGNMPGGRFVNDLRTVCDTADADAKLDRPTPTQK